MMHRDTLVPSILHACYLNHHQDHHYLHRIHVLSNNETIRSYLLSHVLLKQVCGTDLYIVDMNHFLQSSIRIAQFIKNYDTWAYQSVNHKMYESFCFFRWMIIDDYVTEKIIQQGMDIQHIATIDSDVLLLVPLPVQLLYAITPWEFIAQILGAVQYWNPSSLSLFADYVSCAHSNRSLLEAIVLKYADRLPKPCQPTHSLLLPCVDVTNQYHFSDMHLALSFISFNTSIRRHGNQAKKICEIVYHFEPEHTKRIAYSQHDHHFHLRGINGTLSQKALCVVHFGGPAKTHMQSFSDWVRTKGFFLFL